MRHRWKKSFPFLTHNSPPSSPLIVLRRGKWQTKNIFTFCPKIYEIALYLFQHSFTSRVEYIFFFEAISNAKVVFIEFPPFLNEFTHFLHFVHYIECSFKWWGAVPKKFSRRLFLPKSSPTSSPIVLVVHRSLARQLSIPRHTLTTKPSSRASSYKKPKFAAFWPRTTFSSEKRSKKSQCKSTIEC